MDISVVYLTRLHGIAQKIAHTFTFDDYHMTNDFAAAPMSACVKALEADCLRLKTNLPAEYHQNGM